MQVIDRCAFSVAPATCPSWIYMYLSGVSVSGSSVVPGGGRVVRLHHLASPSHRHWWQCIKLCAIFSEPLCVYPTCTFCV